MGVSTGNDVYFDADHFFLYLIWGTPYLGTSGCLAVYGLDVVLIIDPFSMDIAGKGSRLVRPGMGGGR